MKKIYFLLIIGVILTLHFPSYAKGKCYTQQEAEAEQGLRIHSELMVIALNCQHIKALSEENIYLQYRKMTQNHADLFGQYENTLLEYYKKIHDPDPVARLNSLRTRFANKISNNVAGMRPDIFCLKHVPRIKKALKMNQHQIRQWASQVFSAHPVSYPLCQE